MMLAALVYNIEQPIEPIVTRLLLAELSRYYLALLEPFQETVPPLLLLMDLGDSLLLLLEHRDDVSRRTVGVGEPLQGPAAAHLTRAALRAALQRR